jgi:hypothetical protein
VALAGSALAALCGHWVRNTPSHIHVFINSPISRLKEIGYAVPPGFGGGRSPGQLTKFSHGLQEVWTTNEDHLCLTRLPVVAKPYRYMYL